MERALRCSGTIGHRTAAGPLGLGARPQVIAVAHGSAAHGVMTLRLGFPSLKWGHWVAVGG